MTLTAEQVENRLRIVIEVDAAVCGGCGKTVPDDAHKVDGWFIDSHSETDPANPDGVEYADIRCPECW
jgi:hypothetical protein